MKIEIDGNNMRFSRLISRGKPPVVFEQTYGVPHVNKDTVAQYSHEFISSLSERHGFEIKDKIDYSQFPDAPEPEVVAPVRKGIFRRILG